eukprot:5349092-Alexandrium_andersonii.AAC.1
MNSNSFGPGPGGPLVLTVPGLPAGALPPRTALGTHSEPLGSLQNPLGPPSDRPRTALDPPRNHSEPSRAI